MNQRKFLKFSLKITILSMGFGLIFNYYYNNFMDSKNINVEEFETSKIEKSSKYDTFVSNPEYFFRDKNSREIFLSAKEANKLNSKVNIDLVSGRIKLSETYTFNFISDKAILESRKRIILLKDNTLIESKNNNLVILSKDITVNYANYSISSNSHVNINYDNFELNASKFNFDGKESLYFTDGVSVKIKNVDISGNKNN